MQQHFRGRDIGSSFFCKYTYFEHMFKMEADFFRPLFSLRNETAFSEEFPCAVPDCAVGGAFSMWRPKRSAGVPPSLILYNRQERAAWAGAGESSL